MSSWNSYPDIKGLGHKALKPLEGCVVQVEEKIDGSQFSFGVNEQGELRFRSKGAEILADAPEAMFREGMEAIKAVHADRGLMPGWTYRGEYLKKPKHNTLAYGRIPAHHVILFDIATELEDYLPYEMKANEARRLGLEMVPLLGQAIMPVAQAQLDEWLDRESVLGGCKIEGIVLKQYALFGQDNKALFAKYVSVRFKEVHRTEWKNANPASGDILDRLAAMYKTEARWEKAVQHLREAGVLEGGPRDIGKLYAEVPRDVEQECEEEIKNALYRWAWPQVRRRLSHGLAEWYKAKLME